MEVWAMETNRVEALANVLKQNPADTFARYALAMEYTKASRFEDAVNEFREIRRASPDYAAAYFHEGQTLEKLGRLDEAREAYRGGIEVTTRTGDSHTRTEMQAALDILGG